MFAMSAKLSCAAFVLVISSIVAADDLRTGNVSVRLFREKTRYLVVEEVDKDGRSEVKELELPEYDDSEEAREDEQRRREQRYEHQERAADDGCGSSDLGERRSCLAKWRRWLRSSYRHWKEAMKRVMRVVDDRIRNLSAEIREDLNLQNG